MLGKLSLNPDCKELKVASVCNCGMVKICKHLAIKLLVLGLSKVAQMRIQQPCCCISELCCLLAAGVDSDQSLHLPFAFFPFGKVH